MMPENSFQKLNDETFPASLLLEFDDLDDDIPISPPRILEPVNIISASGEFKLYFHHKFLVGFVQRRIMYILTTEP